MFKKLLCFAGWTLLLSALLILAVLITIWFDENLWLAIVIWLALIATVFLFRIIWSGIAKVWRKEYLRHLYAPLHFTRAEHVLFEHWRSGANIIRRLSRKRRALPWFVCIGERCGKTTLLANAGLPTSFRQSGTETIVPTRTLGWWFFRQLALVDVASNLVSGKPAAQAAWKKLVNWSGRLTAPSGIVVGISCHDLMHLSPLQLHQQARKLRTHLESLMVECGRKLPIFIIMTRGDEIPGLLAWANQLSSAQRQQALGYRWSYAPVVDRQDEMLLEPLFARLQQGIELSHVSMLQGAIPDNNTATILDFQQHLLQLQPALHGWLAALNEPDALFPGGQLTGIWLTAQQHPASQALESLFVQELLVEVLPVCHQQQQHQALSAHKQWLMEWRKPLIAGVLASWMLLTAGLSLPLMVSTNSHDVETLTQRLEVNERWMAHPFRYMPYLPLLRSRHSALEEALMKASSVTFTNARMQIKRWRAAFLEAEPAQQRQMILQLAQTIRLRQSMLQGESLSELAQRPATPEGLVLIKARAGMQELTVLALERASLRTGRVKPEIQAMQQLLVELVSSDSQWRWLIAPNEKLQPLTLQQFMPENLGSASLNGIWLPAGTPFLESVVEQIQQASGEEATLPVFQAFWQHYPALRQDAWLMFLLEMSRANALQPGQKARTSELMALAKGEDSGSKLVQQLDAALADINKKQAKSWLVELRRVAGLQRAPSALPLLQKLNDREQQLRSALRRAILRSPRDASINTDDIDHWQQWREALAQMINRAVSDAGHAPFIARTRSGDQINEQGQAMMQLQHRWLQLRDRLANRGSDAGQGAVWTLLERQLTTLTTHALASSACWLEDQWQSRVIAPLGKQAKMRNAAQQQEKVRHYLADFIQSAAAPLLISTPAGIRPLSLLGQSLPVTPDFMQMVNHILDPDDLLSTPEREVTRDHDAITHISEQLARHEKQRTALEQKSLNVEITSLPATVPGGARLLPVGTRVELHCARQSAQLESNNLQDKAVFNWTPNQCNAVSLTVRFPGVELKHRYVGDSAWSDFLSDFSTGERLFKLDEFSADNLATLRDLNIPQVLVRYRVQGAKAVIARWQQWQNLNDEIDQLQNERDELAARQKARQQTGHFQGKLTALPTSIAMCSN